MTLLWVVGDTRWCASSFLMAVIRNAELALLDLSRAIS